MAPTESRDAMKAESLPRLRRDRDETLLALKMWERGHTPHTHKEKERNEIPKYKCNNASARPS